MKRIAATLLFCAGLSPVMAADAVPPKLPLTPAATSPSADTVKSSPKPYLGIKIDDSAFDPNGGLPIEQVVPGSTAADLDLRKGDRLVSLNGQKLSSKDDLVKGLASAKVGDDIEVVATRTGEAKPLTKRGKLAERLRHESIWEMLNAIRAEVKDVKAQSEAAGPKLSLPQILDRLKDIEAALPAAVAEFKKQYPQGDFSFSMHIDIVSDRNAKNPVTVSNHTTTEPKPEPKSAPKSEAKPPQ